MLHHRNKLLAAASVAVTAAAVAVSGLTAASAAAPAATGTEHFQIMMTSATSNTGPVTFTGVFTTSSSVKSWIPQRPSITFRHSPCELISPLPYTLISPC